MDEQITEQTYSCEMEAIEQIFYDQIRRMSRGVKA